MESTNNQYILKWREHVLKAAEALKKHDYEEYETQVGEMERAYEEYRKDEDLSYTEENSFGVANEMFESALPKLYMNNRQAIKEYITLVKEDKNLQAQFVFYETLKKYKPEYNLKNYLEEAIKLTLEKINPKTIKESNKKAYSILRKYNIKPTDYINESNILFYRDCNTIFTHPKSLTNLAKLNETYNKIASHVEASAKLVRENKAQVPSLNEFVEKYNKTLTEAEKSLLNTLLDSKNDAARRSLYENQKKECIDKIETMLTESDDATKGRLNSLLASIQNREYNKQTILEDMVKLLEINEILAD